MITSDKAITKTEQDFLGRKTFSRHLAKTIIGWNKKESIIIGLFGPWGCGKTSILNLTEEDIKLLSKEIEAEKAPIIIRFNPWSFSEKDLILEAFFNKITFSLGAIDDNYKKRLSPKFKKFVNILSVAQDVPKIGGIFKVLNKTIDQISPDKNLEQIKNEIESILNDIGRRLIIVIDDIDRLSNLEIRQLFKIIKMNADFHETIYKFLISQLDDLIYSFNKENWSLNRWTNLINSGFLTFFSSLRDVKRFLNSIEFTFQSVKNEVNSIDFIAIEVIRVFEPDVYHEIANNKFLFTSKSTSDFTIDSEKKEVRRLFDTIFKKSQSDITLIRDICIFLFPVLDSVYEKPIHEVSSKSQWRKERKICSIDVFDIYFSLEIPTGFISKSELLYLRGLCDNPQLLKTEILEFYSQNKLLSFLDQARDISDDLNLNQIKGFIQAIYEVSIELPVIKGSFMRVSSNYRFYTLIKYYLEKLEKDIRCEYFNNLISHYESIDTAIGIIRSSDFDDGKISEESIFSEECVDTLKELIIKKIITLVEGNNLFNQKFPGRVLLNWKRWSKDDISLKKFTNQMLENKKLLINVLTSFLFEGVKFSSGSNVEEAFFDLDYKSFIEFIDQGNLEFVSEKLNVDERLNLSSRQIQAIDIFIEKYKENKNVL